MVKLETWRRRESSKVPLGAGVAAEFTVFRKACQLITLKIGLLAIFTVVVVSVWLGAGMDVFARE